MQLTLRLPALCLLTAAAFIFSSCSKTNKEGRYVPKNAAIVVLVNGESISSKLPWADVKQNELFKQLYQDSTLEAYIKSALDNPDNTGIDTKKDFLFFVQKDSIGGYVAIEGTVKDVAKFKQFNTDATKAGAEKEKDGIHFISNNKMTASWEKEKFVIVIDAPELNDINKFSNMNDSSSASMPAVKRDAVAVCTQIFALKENNSLGKEAKFTELVKQKGDIHFWMNIGEFNTGTAGMAALSMLNMSKLYEGSLATATASFEDGKILIDTKSYAGKELSEIWKKYAGNKVNTDMIKNIPGKDVAVLFALNFKPEGIREFVKLAGLDGFINMGAAFIGFNLDDFIKANKGDILFSMSDITTDSTGKPDMNVLFSASVGDKDAFGKLISAGNKLGKDKLGMGSPQIFYNTNDKLFAIGNNKESVNKFITAGGKSDFDFIDKISGGPAAGYVNFQLLLKAFGKEANRDSLDNIMYESSLKMWDNLIVKGGGFEDGGSVQHVEINLVDKKSNSLKQLNNYMGLVGKIQQEKKIIRDREFEAYAPVTEEPVTEAEPAN